VTATPAIIPEVDARPLVTPDEVVVRAERISKSFPGVRALDNVSLELRRGRLTALLGENGAGKSTLMNILAGVFPPDAGRVLVRGAAVRFHGVRDAQRRGISMIFQELNLLPNLTVAENIFIGREPKNRLGFIDYRRMNREAAAMLDELDLPIPPTTPVGRLRVGQQQVVEIAKALSYDPVVMIMDEPTSALTAHEVDVLFGLVQRLKRRGVAIAYITHKFEELTQVGDDAVIMRDGRVVGAAPLAGLSRAEIVRLMVGRDAADFYPKAPAAPREEVLRAEGVSLRDPRRPGEWLVKDVDLHVRRGEVLGIFGLMGAGRTELLETVFGLHPKAGQGRVSIDGRPVRIASPADAIAAGMAMAPEDRKREGLVLPMAVAANASLVSLRDVERAGFIDSGRERRLVGKYVDRLRVKTPSLRTPVRNLSGGNQQKVILAKWLAAKPKILLLDEPTRGIDVGAKREIYTLIDELAHGGLGVVVVSSELPEVLAIADRVMVMCEGRKTAELARDEANEQNVMSAALPKAPVKPSDV
jgi:ribose transport system ATP-binding protein